MSNREFAKTLIDQISEAKLVYIIPYLQGAALSDEMPNQETIDAITEVQQMINTNSGDHFSGSTDDFFAMLAEE